ncbi:type II toxin-antitoxin system RelE family toxin [Billgrantia gudaonensis]|uniref:mRNA interferase RelE/StbE n=1 Tax=Billgrantia gudaonensis TaxID=376427 RepID=A0A1G9DVR5_9GAMM|nr:type II toxin-antitoxin system RelE/ParE family toxin [Halomonas gudaonensis]SDK67991.1 mRNA interferase RelE/StbE [Halomonas gudaonensis]
MTTISYSKDALKTLKRMPRPDAQRIQRKISAYAEDPTAQRNNVKALVGSEYIRLRVGDWRVIMDDRGTVLLVLKIGARGDVYR